ncbi:hypothetical protein ACJ72_05740 [Emergomyces africanus]|uniref:Nucleolar protein Dnt1-like N-terminal domain-containing protein n=1 Tax=Emergomyces africanus TaxID=1955775 RepID=A0A1B7NT17_9EURO|nr:hypothetical protein ACJ72_05740 [Emergomyces africanus]
MVLLRLTVKVYPREQLGQPCTPDSAANNDVTRPAATFLMVVWRPEEMKLGKLACMIQEKWKRLKPDAEPLEIRKLVDDKYEEDALDAELTVADVFVDSGKALADGLDQRGAIRVIQQPGRPERYGSVIQDWAAVTNKYVRAPPPLFSDPLRNGHNGYSPETPAFLNGRAPGSSQPAQLPQSDYAVPSTESGEERPNRQDNHTHASPILVEDSQKSCDFTSYAGENRDLPNDERTTSTKNRGGSVVFTPEEKIGYGGTIFDALRYDYAKEEAAMRDMNRREFLRASVPLTRTSAPNSSLSNPKVRSTPSTNNNSKPGATRKRQIEADDTDDIYAIPPTDQESKKAKKPQTNKRQRHTISRSDELTLQHNLKTFPVSLGDGANNAIVLDSDVGEDKPAVQVQGGDNNMVIDHESTVRRGTRKSIIRGPGRKSMAIKLPLTLAEDTKNSTRGTAATKIPPKKKTPVPIADSDVEIIDGPAPPQTTSRSQGSHPPFGGNSVVAKRDEANRNIPNTTDSMNKGSIPISSTYQLTHLDAESSKPIHSNVQDSNNCDDNAGTAASGEQNDLRVAPPEQTPQTPAGAAVDTPQTSRNGSVPKLQTQSGIGALELTMVTESNSRRLSHSSPSRPLGQQESGLGITVRTGESSTPAFPRPRTSSQVPTERRGSILESEKSSSSDLRRTPLLPALRSTQKSSPRTVSTRRSVSFVDDKPSTPASASSIKVGNTVYPPGVTPEWVEWMRTDGELQKKLDQARLQGKSEDYCGCVEEVKHFATKLYKANVSKIGYRITKYERNLKRAKQILQNHPEEDHPAEHNLAGDHRGKNHRQVEENGEEKNDKDGSNGSQHKSQARTTGGDSTSPEVSLDLKKPRTASGSKGSVTSHSPNMPSTGSFAMPLSSLSARRNVPPVEKVEAKMSVADGHDLSRKRPESKSSNAPNGAAYPLSDHDTHPSQPEQGSKEMSADMLGQVRPGELERRNGKSPVRDVKDMLSSESSSSDSDSDSESDSNLMGSKNKIGKPPVLPPRGGSARRALITPFRDLKKNWPKSDHWLSDEPPTAENKRTSGTVGLGTPSFSQPAPSTRLKSPDTNGGFLPKGRATLKTLIQSQRGSEDDSSAKNASESESLQGGSNSYTGFNILRRVGMMK